MSISHGSTVRVSRDHLATKLQGNSCECLPQDCVHLLEHLVGYNSVSRDLPSSRWHPSTQAISFALATESPSRDFVLVPLWMDSMTMSKLSPSVRADNTTKSCPSKHANCNCCCCDHVLRFCCKRQSSTHIREHTRHVVLDLLGPDVEMFSSA